MDGADPANPAPQPQPQEQSLAPCRCSKEKLLEEQMHAQHREGGDAPAEDKVLDLGRVY